jgi:hypothetical protein
MRVGERGARLGPKGDELALVLPSRKAEVMHVVRGGSLLVRSEHLASLDRDASLQAKGGVLATVSL